MNNNDYSLKNILNEKIGFYTPNPKDIVIQVDATKVEKKLGVKLNSNQIQEYVQGMVDKYFVVLETNDSQMDILSNYDTTITQKL